ncbi:type I toxin-antitoxin system SymE family toxin [Xanthomonas translucens pv. poae]|nr:type I toxin-antitoxin system SymE family toxin [Xanthomonas translucens pv. poae]
MRCHRGLASCCGAGPGMRRASASKGSAAPEGISGGHANSQLIHAPLAYPVLHRHTGDSRVPVLRLSGLWLEQLGFAIGSKVRITARAGELVVSLISSLRAFRSPCQGDLCASQT